MTDEKYDKALAEEMKRKTEALHAELEVQYGRAEKLQAQLETAALPFRYDTYAMAVSTYGKQSQLIMTMEEMSELTKELSKNIRGAKNISAISEEIADVEIMLEQLKIIFSNRAEVDRQRSDKLRRLADRLVHELA